MARITTCEKATIAELAPTIPFWRDQFEQGPIGAGNDGKETVADHRHALRDLIPQRDFQRQLGGGAIKDDNLPIALVEYDYAASYSRRRLDVAHFTRPLAPSSIFPDELPRGRELEHPLPVSIQGKEPIFG